jgi:flagellar motor switch protein FliM
VTDAIAETPAVKARTRQVRAVDFNRPTKFTPEQERRLRRTVDDFCRAASTRLAAEIRVPLELEVVAASQLVWTDAHARVASDCIAATVMVRPAERPMLLCVEPALVTAAIDLLTGASEVGGDERRLTDIDRALGELFVERLLAQLAPVWSDVLGFELELGGLESHLDTAQMTQVSEPTLSIVLEARLAETASTLTLLVPWRVFAPAAARFDRSDEEADAEAGQSLAGGIGATEVVLRGRVGHTQLRLRDVLALRPGDVVPLGARVGEGVTICVDDVPVHGARLGVSNGRRGVQVR